MTSMKGEKKMNQNSDRSVEYKMDVLVGYILLVGVLTSISLIIIGVIWHYAATGDLGLNYSISGMNLFQFVSSELRQIRHFSLRPRLFVNLGIATLLLTPYIRVMASVLFFAFGEKNYKYTVFTAIVYCVLTYSLFLR